MTNLTLRLPDDTAERLKLLAKQRGQSVNKLLEQLSVQALTSWDAENRFKAMSLKADTPAALAILDRLDKLT
ncbi:MAG: ribbon-helix-helix protein, CopG family [Thiotrichales bacterium]|nr:ribbon-helix-helix protein, CopG family [Thiotrichales bacterium]